MKEAAVPVRLEAGEDRRADLQLILDQELAQLPEKYRLVILLCDLEGKTRKQVALELGWPVLRPLPLDSSSCSPNMNTPGST